MHTQHGTSSPAHPRPALRYPVSRRGAGGATNHHRGITCPHPNLAHQALSPCASLQHAPRIKEPNWRTPPPPGRWERRRTPSLSLSPAAAHVDEARPASLTVAATQGSGAPLARRAARSARLPAARRCSPAESSSAAPCGWREPWRAPPRQLLARPLAAWSRGSRVFREDSPSEGRFTHRSDRNADAERGAAAQGAAPPSRPRATAPPASARASLSDAAARPRAASHLSAGPLITSRPRRAAVHAPVRS